jgi:hypothetical protein
MTYGGYRNVIAVHLYVQTGAWGLPGRTRFAITLIKQVFRFRELPLQAGEFGQPALRIWTFLPGREQDSSTWR